MARSSIVMLFLVLGCLKSCSFESNNSDSLEGALMVLSSEGASVFDITQALYSVRRHIGNIDSRDQLEPVPYEHIAEVVFPYLRSPNEAVARNAAGVYMHIEDKRVTEVLRERLLLNPDSLNSMYLHVFKVNGVAEDVAYYYQNWDVWPEKMMESIIYTLYVISRRSPFDSLPVLDRILAEKTVDEPNRELLLDIVSELRSQADEGASTGVIH